MVPSHKLTLLPSFPLQECVVFFSRFRRSLSWFLILIFNHSIRCVLLAARLNFDSKALQKEINCSKFITQKGALGCEFPLFTRSRFLDTNPEPWEPPPPPTLEIQILDIGRISNLSDLDWHCIDHHFGLFSLLLFFSALRQKMAYEYKCLLYFNAKWL